MSIDLKHLDRTSVDDEEEKQRERVDQLGMLPGYDEVATVIHHLSQKDLQEFAASIMNAAVDSAHKGYVDIDTIRLLNGWFASMEETVAAGDDLENILARRRKSRSASAPT